MKMLKRRAASCGVNPEIHGPQNKEEKKQNQVLINKIGGCSMVQSWCQTPMTGLFHTWHSRCEGVGWDSGREHEGLHLMHDIDISYHSNNLYGM